MPGYNNYGAYTGATITANQQRIVPTPGVSVNGWNGNWNGYSQSQQSSDGKIYVNGRAGADAYQLPAGINFVILWDTESSRFYVKGYDNNGMPRVLEDNDYAPHVEPETVSNASVDMSSYATKDDINKMRQDFDKILSQLAVGNGGRIVRMNESNG